MVKSQDEFNKRITDAAEEAEDAFWQVISTSFPECTTGDYDGNFEDHAKEAIVRWLKLNLPEDLVK